VSIDQTSIKEAFTTISPAIRLEFGDVLSILTATSSHSSPDVDVSDAEGTPPNHHDICNDDVDPGIVLRLCGISGDPTNASIPEEERNINIINTFIMMGTNNYYNNNFLQTTMRLYIILFIVRVVWY